MTDEHWDVFTALRFADGNIAGVQTFRAMLDNLSLDSKDQTARVLKIISEAVATVHDPSAGVARKSASVKLLELVAESLKFQAMHSSYVAWLDTQQHEAERSRQVVLRLEHIRASHRAKEEALFQSFLAGVLPDQ